MTQNLPELPTDGSRCGYRHLTHYSQHPGECLATCSLVKPSYDTDLFIVDHKGDRDLRVVRPLGIVALLAVANQVSREVVVIVPFPVSYAV